MAYSMYDSHQFARYLPRLLELAQELDHEAHQALTEAIEHVWVLYYPLGEDLDLAHQIACLLYAMDDYPRALVYFARSMKRGTSVQNVHNFLKVFLQRGFPLEKDSK